jgi:hypothetical protein
MSELCIISLHAHKMQETACGVLCNLAVNSAGNQAQIGLGGIEALLKAMEEHPAHAGVQEAACWALFIYQISF